MLVAIKKVKMPWKKCCMKKSVHEKSVSFVISQKNLFVPKIRKQIFLTAGGGGGAGAGGA